eukprot:2358383-Pyramimonas_sp.AAC.3
MRISLLAPCRPHRPKHFANTTGYGNSRKHHAFQAIARDTRDSASPPGHTPTLHTAAARPRVVPVLPGAPAPSRLAPSTNTTEYNMTAQNMTNTTEHNITEQNRA